MRSKAVSTAARSVPGRSRATPSCACWAHGLYGRCENISRAALGADELGPRGVRLELLPQASHLHVDRTVVDLVVVQAREVEQLITREHPLRRGEERRKQVELAVGQRDDLAVQVLSSGAAAR